MIDFYYQIQEKIFLKKKNKKKSIEMFLYFYVNKAFEMLVAFGRYLDYFYYTFII